MEVIALATVATRVFPPLLLSLGLATTTSTPMCQENKDLALKSVALSST